MCLMGGIEVGLSKNRMIYMFYARIGLSALFALLGAILAVQGVSGWGWFLLVAALTAPIQ